jgi:hypothetical protein
MLFTERFGNLFQLIILHDRLPGGKQPLRVRVALAVRDIGDDVLDHLIGSGKAERRRISDVQLQNFLAGFFHARGFCYNRSADIVQHMVELTRFCKFSHDQSPPVRFSFKPDENPNVILSSLHAGFAIRPLTLARLSVTL